MKPGIFSFFAAPDANGNSVYGEHRYSDPSILLENITPAIIKGAAFLIGWNIMGCFGGISVCPYFDQGDSTRLRQIKEFISGCKKINPTFKVGCSGRPGIEFPYNASLGLPQMPDPTFNPSLIPNSVALPVPDPDALAKLNVGRIASLIAQGVDIEAIYWDSVPLVDERNLSAYPGTTGQDDYTLLTIQRLMPNLLMIAEYASAATAAAGISLYGVPGADGSVGSYYANPTDLANGVVSEVKATPAQQLAWAELSPDKGMGSMVRPPADVNGNPFVWCNDDTGPILAAKYRWTWIMDDCFITLPQWAWMFG
jgi:hypothetical protein